MKLETILHPTDFSESAERALDLAAMLATAHDATLQIVHAELLHGEPRDTKHELDQYAERARGLLGGGGAGRSQKLVVTQTRSILAFDAIIRAAAESSPDLIVMGTYGRSGFSKLLMGSTAEKVLRHASCAVLTVKAQARLPEGKRFRRLLVPVDFSVRSHQALDGVRALRAQDATATYLVHVVEPLPALYYAGGLSSFFELDPDLRDRIKKKMRTWAEDLTDWEPTITEGNVALEVTRLAEVLGVDLIVMTSQGLTAVERLLVGSVTERVCRVSTVPVLTMR